MNQISWIYDQLQSLKTATLIQIIDELKLTVANDSYKEMATDIYNQAKQGCELTYKQKRVLVNIIGKPR